jgi:hypothetical protein
MKISKYKTKNDLVSDLLHYINKEKIKVKLNKKSKSELILEAPDNSIIITLIIDNINYKLLYDVYLTEYKKHIEERDLSNFEKMYSLQIQKGKWHLPRYLPDVLMIFDEIYVWTKNANFCVIGKMLK